MPHGPCAPGKGTLLSERVRTPPQAVWKCEHYCRLTPAEVNVLPTAQVNLSYLRDLAPADEEVWVPLAVKDRQSPGFGLHFSGGPWDSQGGNGSSPWNFHHPNTQLVIGKLIPVAHLLCE